MAALQIVLYLTMLNTSDARDMILSNAPRSNENRKLLIIPLGLRAVHQRGTRSGIRSKVTHGTHVSCTRLRTDPDLQNRFLLSVTSRTDLLGALSLWTNSKASATRLNSLE